MPVIYNNRKYKAPTQIIVTNKPKCCEECIFHKEGLINTCFFTEKDTEFISDLGFKRKEKDTRTDCPLIDIDTIIQLIKDEVRYG